MNANDTYLAVFLGSHTNTRMKAWSALTEAERQARQSEGMAAWKSWMDKNRAAIVGLGGPLGKTKKASPQGIEDTRNEMTAFTVVARRVLTRRRQNCSRIIPTSRSSRATASRSCRSCRSPANSKRPSKIFNSGRRSCA